MKEKEMSRRKLVFSPGVGNARGMLHREGVFDGLFAREGEVLELCVSFLRGRGHEVVLLDVEDESTAEIPISGWSRDLPPPTEGELDAVAADIFGRNTAIVDFDDDSDDDDQDL